MLLSGVLLLDPHARREHRREQMRIFATTQLTLEKAELTLLLLNTPAHLLDVLGDCANLNMDTFILMMIAVTRARDVPQQLIGRLDGGRQALLRLQMIGAV